MATPRKRPRSTFSFGSSSVNASDLGGLQAAWRAKRLVLFLGSGVSTQWGVPAWKDLVLELLFDQTAEARRLRGLWPNYRRALAEWLADYFDYDPVILARVVKTDARQRGRDFRGMVRRHLYAGLPAAKARRSGSPTRTTLDAVADLLAHSAPGGNVPAVVTYNFDDLLEQALASRKVRHHVIRDGHRTRGDGLPVIHPHGFLPLATDPAASDLVFTEDDYHQLTDSVFHWALTRVVGFLRESTVLFVGLSMSDPSLRRLLDASHERGTRPDHWQVQQRHRVKAPEKEVVLGRIESLARRHAAILGDRKLREPQALSDAVDAILRQADTYDRKLFESMGVKTIWLADYADLPALLDRVAPRR
jgi:hypothetical protein